MASGNPKTLGWLVQSLQAYGEVSACRHLSARGEHSASDTRDAALGTSTPLAGTSHVLRAPGAPKLTTVPSTSLISTALAARLGQTERGGSFSIPMPRYLTAHPPASPPCYPDWTWHPGTILLPDQIPAWQRSHLALCQDSVKTGDSRGRSDPAHPGSLPPDSIHLPVLGGTLANLFLK